VVRFFLSDAASVSTGFKNSEKGSYDVVAASLCPGASAILLPVERTATQRRGYRRANLLDGFEVSLICGRTADMFRARPEADETCGQLSQSWKPFQQTEHEWKAGVLLARRPPGNNMTVNEDLHSLNKAGRPFTARLHRSQVVKVHGAVLEFFREQVCSRHCVLNSEVDSDTACW
jgi:hypothetical protein